MNLKRPAVDDTVKQKLPVRRIAEKTAIGSAIAGGTAASIIGFVAAGSPAAGAAVGAVAGGAVGSGILDVRIAVRATSGGRFAHPGLGGSALT